MENQLNDLTIKWSVVLVEGYITKKIQEEIKRNKVIGIGSSISDNAIYTHSGNDEKAQVRNAEFVKILKRNDRTGRIITITDKQFGLSKINYSGVAEIDNSNPLSQYIVIIDGYSKVMTIPVTSEQLKNQITF